MIEHVKKKYPHVYLYTSTNGLLLDGGKDPAWRASGIDEVTFSVDGADPRTYARYRQGGDFAKLLKNMAALAAEKRRLGREVPFINWRYILFKWNDSFLADGQGPAPGRKNRRRPPDLGDHRPPRRGGIEEIPGRQPAPGKGSIYQIWDTSQIGSALRGKRFIARIRAGAKPAGRPRRAETGPGAWW